jgi:hypothetical protein
MSEAPTPAPRKKSCLVPVLLTIIVVLLLGIGLYLWHNRPIKPVELSAEEKAVVAEKIEVIQQEEGASDEPTYEKGKREIVLSERELNGLLNEHTSLGGTLKFELGTDVLLARLETDLDPDLPVVGGRKLKAKARFFVKAEGGVPTLVLDDLTVWGVSLPNDWLGQLKGRNILGEILGGGQSGSLAGIEELVIEPRQLKIKLKE